jgi:GNAT superfamily N-acetyltransferase
VKAIQDPDELAGLFADDPETHLYGLADLEEPFWAHSSWYRDGPAVVGLVSAGEDWVTGYAMSRSAPQATLDLLAEVHSELPSGSWITGPLGMAEAMAGVRSIRPIGLHWRMILDKPVETGSTSIVTRLGIEDLDAVLELHSSDPDRSFFLPMMLESYPFVGVWEDGRLMASAGTHVASRDYGVAAVGAVITRPSHRGRGLGARVMAALCEQLASDYQLIGLNVEVANDPALCPYDRLGFRRAFQYEEIEVL